MEVLFEGKPIKVSAPIVIGVTKNVNRQIVKGLLILIFLRIY